ncbi:MAG: hypothetical protein ACTSSP_00010 [Candidatus Asgardarchaeia archaeon]
MLNELEKYKHREEDLLSSLKAMEEKEEQYKSQISDFELKIKTIEKEKERVEKELSYLRKENKELREKIEELQERTKSASEKEKEYKEKMDALIKENENLKRELNEISEQFSRISKMYQEISKERTEVKNISNLLKIYITLLEDVFYGRPHARILWLLHETRERMTRQALNNTLGFQPAVILRAIQELRNADIVAYDEETGEVSLKKRIF